MSIGKLRELGEEGSGRGKFSETVGSTKLSLWLHWRNWGGRWWDDRRRRECRWRDGSKGSRRQVECRNDGRRAWDGRIM
jgi:hypothetical protein